MARSEEDKKREWRAWRNQFAQILPSDPKIIEYLQRDATKTPGIGFITKNICDCPLHQEDLRYSRFPCTGMVAIPRCAGRCPYCE